MSARIVISAKVALAACIVVTASARADIDAGLAGYWPLDGDAADASGDGNAGIIKGDVTPTTDRSGYQDYAMHFPGRRDAYIDLGLPPGLLVHRATTAAAWVRADNLDQGGRIIAKHRNGDYGRSWSLQVTAGGIARFEIAAERATGISVDSQTLTFGPAEWFHVAGVFRPGEALELWINGRLEALRPVTITSHFIDNHETISIGGGDTPWHIGGGGTPWHGDIDEVRLYARALSPADVNELYAFVPAPHFKAWDPQPPDGAIGVTSSFLTWKPSVTAALCALYFGRAPTLGPDDLFSAPWVFHAWIDWPPVEPGVTYYWRVDGVKANGETVHTGDVWHFITQPYGAFDPWPADGAQSVSNEMDLSWSPGRNAISYEVYFGTDPTALGQSSGGIYVPCTKFDPGLLQMGTTYYWRVDEISNADPHNSASTEPDETWKGPVWSFTTADHPVVDDFESYGDDDSYYCCNPVSFTWIAWLPDRTSDLGPLFDLDPPFIERTIVYGGRQAMTFDYNNVVPPYYSEVERYYELPQDWTINEGDTLVLHVRGLPANDPEPLYIAIQDSSNRICVVAHPDRQVLLAAEWSEWKIPLSSLAGVNPARITKMYIGVGDRAYPVPGGTGWLYVDDIYVTRFAVEEPNEMAGP